LVNLTHKPPRLLIATNQTTDTVEVRTLAGQLVDVVRFLDAKALIDSGQAEAVGRSRLRFVRLFPGVEYQSHARHIDDVRRSQLAPRLPEKGNARTGMKWCGSIGNENHIAFPLAIPTERSA
jgi:hypothetical protein